MTADGEAGFNVSLNSNRADKLRAGVYRASVTVRDRKNKIVQSLPFTLSIGQNVPALKIEAVARPAASFDLTFPATPGASYQVQYKTNFTQPDWLNLGSPMLAQTNSLKFSDTDIANHPQKFYRLMLAQ